MPGAVAQGLIWGIMAIGVYLTYKILDVADLTVDGTMSLGGAVCVMMLMKGQNIWVAIIVAVIAGMLAGLVTGIFHTFMGIPVLLASILTQLGLYSVNLKILGKANQAISVDNYDLIVSLRFVKGVAFYKNTIFIVAIFILVIIALLYWFFGTELGCSIRSTGCNPNMSRAQGINTNFNVILGLMISNGLVALASALYSQYQGFADVNAGRGAIVIGLAAVIIGGVIFEKIFHNFALKLLGVAIGAVIYYTVLQVVIWAGFDTDLLKLLSALVVAVFLAMPYWQQKYFAKPVKKGDGEDA
jgi:putative ABC transport system permease protein